MAPRNSNRSKQGQRGGSSAGKGRSRSNGRQAESSQRPAYGAAGGVKQRQNQRETRGQRGGAQERSYGERGAAQARGYGNDRRGGQDRGGYRGKGRGMSLRGGEDISILEGRHALEEAVQTKTPIDLLYVTESLAADPDFAQVIEAARAQGAKVRFADAEDLEGYSSHGAHQGVIAQLKPYKYGYLRDLIDAAEGKENALIVATDHVTDAGNFGAIVRTAEVVGASGILIPNKRNARVNTAAYKTSAGAVMHLPIAMEANLARSLEALKEEGFWIVGASEHAEDVLWDAPLSGRVVLVMGSEGDGLSRITADACDLLVKLPQLGRVESLNVAQACTAICYEWARQCRNAGE